MNMSHRNSFISARLLKCFLCLMFISIYEPLLLYSVMLDVVIACVNLATDLRSKQVSVVVIICCYYSDILDTFILIECEMFAV